MGIIRRRHVYLVRLSLAREESQSGGVADLLHKPIVYTLSPINLPAEVRSHINPATKETSTTPKLSTEHRPHGKRQKDT